MMGGGLRELVICHHCTYQDMQWFEDSLTHVYMVHYTYIDVYKYIHIIFKIEVIFFGYTYVYVVYYIMILSCI